MEQRQRQKQSQSQSPASGMGYLIVRASTAGGAIPLEGATVKIWRDFPVSEESTEPKIHNGDVHRVLLTDRDGNTPRISLITPPREISYTPGGIPYAYYHIDVTADGFYPQEFIRVPIYDGITSIQNAYLIPIAEGNVINGQEPLTDRVDESVNPLL